MAGGASLCHSPGGPLLPLGPAHHSTLARQRERLRRSLVPRVAQSWPNRSPCGSLSAWIGNPVVRTPSVGSPLAGGKRGRPVGYGNTFGPPRPGLVVESPGYAAPRTGPGPSGDVRPGAPGEQEGTIRLGKACAGSGRDPGRFPPQTPPGRPALATQVRRSPLPSHAEWYYAMRSKSRDRPPSCPRSPAQRHGGAGRNGCRIATGGGPSLSPSSARPPRGHRPGRSISRPRAGRGSVRTTLHININAFHGTEFQPRLSEGLTPAPMGCRQPREPGVVRPGPPRSVVHLALQGGDHVPHARELVVHPPAHRPARLGRRPPWP